MTFDFTTYKDLLDNSESNSNYSTNTGNGMFGAYQFSMKTLQSLSLLYQLPYFTKDNIQDFLNNPVLQDRFLFALITDTLNYIGNNNLTRFIGQTITGRGNGITAQVDIYGLVAAAHLGGAGAIKDYFVNNIDSSDNTNKKTGGTYVSDYIAKFSSYLIGSKKKSINSGNSGSNSGLNTFETTLTKGLDLIPDYIKKK